MGLLIISRLVRWVVIAKGPVLMFVWRRVPLSVGALVPSIVVAVGVSLLVTCRVSRW